LPAKIDYEKLSPYFSFRPNVVIKHTLRQIKQLAKYAMYDPMRHHLKIWFQILTHKRLNEVIAIDTFLYLLISGFDKNLFLKFLD
jgi:hypothetical protein